jgi:periplasmic protein TonB
MMTPASFSKLNPNNLLRGSFAPVVIVSVLFHIIFFAGILFLTRTLYRSQEFARPCTFELVKLSQIFEVPVRPQQQPAAPKLKSAAHKTALPAPVPAPVQPAVEKNPVPSEKKAEPAPEPEAPVTVAPPATAAVPQATASTALTSDASPALDKIYEAGMVDEPPVLQKKVAPFYPEFVKDQGISGTVRAQVIIDQNGNVTEITILSSPNELLSDEVYKAVSRWKYKPGKFKGAAVKVRNRDVQVVFQLTE